MFNIQLDPYIVKENLGISRGQVSSVDTSGVYISVPCSKQAKIQQIQIRQITGTGGFNVYLFSDNIHADNILSMSSDPISTRLDVSEIGLYFQNTDATQQALIYLKITPLLGSNNSFTFALFFTKL